ncbi:helix-turn-helix domain-containing protein [Streptomyces sp. NBC_00996]|uniref:helix-turn-helix domain-containing protein n=1 Tax=Streptomyces sp. NBC_00996 TaxID=2903710 RepID=UPI00386F95EA|nr:helix-turn-helix domain-containing protein [Streptomyces sp. NBC_00996]
MGSWQPLPEQLPPEVRHFVEQLRQLKDRTGLSLVALGARTAYSKSSWQRYLNATQPPPRQAVAALCRVAGLASEDTERFGVRWELAVEVWPRVPMGADSVSGGPASGSSVSGGPVSGGPVSGGSSGGGLALGGSSADGAVADVYEDDPTLPWWDAPPPDVSSSGASMGRLPLYAALLLLALLLVTVVGAVTLG